MPDVPPVTITDPKDPHEPRDVLVSGKERPPFRLPRQAIVALVVVALLGASGYGVQQMRAQRASDRAVQRAAEAALAAKDRYDLSTSDLGVGGNADGDGLVNVQVLAHTRDPALLLTRTAFTGSGVVADEGTATSSLLTSDNPLSVQAQIDCSASATSGYPTDWELRLEVTPPSGRAHVVRLPLRPDQVREAILAACDRADPQALPAVTAEEQHGTLVLDVTPVPRSHIGLRIAAITSPGFVLSRSGGAAGAPRLIGPDFGVVFGVTARVTDCALARPGAGVITVQLFAGEREYVLIAVDNRAHEDRRLASALLAALVAAACG